MNVLLLHGLGADRRAFQRFLRLLPSSWHAVAVDLLGHGDAPKPGAGYSLEHLADHAASDIARLRTDGSFVGNDPVVVVGHSYGAATAVALAARHPNLVARLVLLDPVLRMDGGIGDEQLPDETTGASRTQRMFAAKEDGTLEDEVPLIFPENGAALNRWVVDTWTAMAPSVLNEFDNDWPRFAHQITCPITVVSGDVDQGGSGELSMQVFGERANRVRIVGAGHYLHATHAVQTAQAVVDAAQAGEPA